MSRPTRFDSVSAFDDRGHRAKERLATYRVTVTGMKPDLAHYRVEACRLVVAFSGPCLFQQGGPLATRVGPGLVIDHCDPVVNTPNPLSTPAQLSLPAASTEVCTVEFPRTGGGAIAGSGRLRIVILAVAGVAVLVTLAGAALELRREG